MHLLLLISLLQLHVKIMNLTFKVFARKQFLLLEFLHLVVNLYADCSYFFFVDELVLVQSD